MAQPRFTNQNLRNFIATTQGKSVTVAAVTVLLVIVIFLLGIFPAVSSILFQIEENQKREAGITQIDQKRTTLRALATEESQKEDVTRALNSYLPDDVFQEQIFDDLSKLVVAHGLDLVAVSFGGVERRRVLPEVFDTNDALDGAVVSMSVEGDIGDIENFIQALEQSRRIYNLRTISIIRANPGSVDTQYKMDLQAEVYFWNTELD